MKDTTFVQNNNTNNSLMHNIFGDDVGKLLSCNNIINNEKYKIRNVENSIKEKVQPMIDDILKLDIPLHEKNNKIIDLFDDYNKTFGDIHSIGFKDYDTSIDISITSWNKYIKSYDVHSLYLQVGVILGYGFKDIESDDEIANVLKDIYNECAEYGFVEVDFALEMHNDVWKGIYGNYHFNIKKGHGDIDKHVNEMIQSYRDYQNEK